MSLRFNIKGLEKLERDLKALRKNSEAEAGVIVGETAENIRRDASANAPTDLGNLASSVVVENKGTIYTIAVNAPYAPYLEFGTRSKFDTTLIAEWKEEAAKFTGSTGASREDAIRAITDWARRKGIEESAIPSLVFHILANGIESQPFFRPAVQKNVAGLEDRIDKKIQEYLNTL